MRSRRLAAWLVVVWLAGIGVSTGSSARAAHVARPTGRRNVGTVGVRLQPQVVDYRSAEVAVTGIAAGPLQMRLRGATDMRGLAYRWAPYRWRPLRLVRGAWRGLLPRPALLGVYQLQFRHQDRKRLLQSPGWLLRVLPPGTLRKPGFPTPRAVIGDLVNGLTGDQVLIAIRRWPRAAFDHRDPRLIRSFVIAYAPRADPQAESRFGFFVTVFRNGFNGRWRLLQTCTGPCD